MTFDTIIEERIARLYIDGKITEKDLGVYVEKGLITKEQVGLILALK